MTGAALVVRKRERTAPDASTLIVRASPGAVITFTGFSRAKEIFTVSYPLKRFPRKTLNGSAINPSD